MKSTLQRVTLCTIVFFGCSSSRLRETRGPAHKEGAQAANSPSIEVDGHGSTSVFPNAVRMTLVASYTKPRLRDAMDATNATTTQVLDVLNRFIADPSDIKTSLVSTDKAWQWRGSMQQDVPAGYEATQRVHITLRDLSKMQAFTEALLATSVSSIGGITYFRSDAATYTHQAQELAVADALASAERLAKAARVKLGAIVEISMGTTDGDPLGPRLRAAPIHTFAKSMGGVGTTSQGEMLDFNATVHVKVRLN